MTGEARASVNALPGADPIGGGIWIECDGWSLTFAGGAGELAPKLRSELVERALGLAAKEAGEPLRRSRHASTYYLELRSTVTGAAAATIAPAETALASAAIAARSGGGAEVFVKLMDPPASGLSVLRYLATHSRAERLLHIARALETEGFAIAPILMLGEERRGGRTMIATARIAGLPLPRFLLGAAGAPARKRAALRALGAEIARMHRAGFLHGDLTPYNVFVASGAPMRFVFIDHERTVRPYLVWRRRRLRNLVQLCRFDLEGMNRTDRRRVVDAYAQAIGYAPRRLARRLEAMLRARRRRDTAAERVAPAGGDSQRPPA